MKIIDKTSQQDANGNINLVTRVQATLKYGLSWYAELEAQKTVIVQLERVLEKGFILIRNFTLPNSEIVIPIIILGAGGIWVLYVMNAKGNFEASSDQWNVINNDGKSLPAPINYLTRVAKLGIVFQKYLKLQKIDMPNPVETVLIAADPGAQIDSVRPIVRVVRSDAIKQFASSLVQAPPIWRTDFIHELADRIVEATPPEELTPIIVSAQAASAQRGKDAIEQGNPFASELGFAFEDSEPQPAGQDANPENAIRPQANVQRAPVKKKFLGLEDTQIVLLVGLIIVEACIIFGFGILFFVL